MSTVCEPVEFRFPRDRLFYDDVSKCWGGGGEMFPGVEGKMVEGFLCKY